MRFCVRWRHFSGSAQHLCRPAKFGRHGHLLKVVDMNFDDNLTYAVCRLVADKIDLQSPNRNFPFTDAEKKRIEELLDEMFKKEKEEAQYDVRLDRSPVLLLCLRTSHHLPRAQSQLHDELLGGAQHSLGRRSSHETVHDVALRRSVE